MKKYLSILIILFIISFSTIVLAGDILYPWRSTTAIVKGGETFEVWFNADAGQIVKLLIPFAHVRKSTMFASKRAYGILSEGFSGVP